jgi:hypothetical protein
MTGWRLFDYASTFLPYKFPNFMARSERKRLVRAASNQVAIDAFAEPSGGFIRMR